MPRAEAILVINAGSSSLKFQVYHITGDGLVCHQKGQIDGIGTRPALRVRDGDGRVLAERSWPADAVPDLPAAIAILSDRISALDDIHLSAVGHRVVHGGPDFTAPVLMDLPTLEKLARYQELAPLHQPNNLAPIRLAMEVAPDLPQVACFDTAFHRGQPVHADCYALPPEYYDQGVCRYGFHGLSYEYIAQRLPEVAPEIAGGRVIVAHLGSGASMCALKAGRSIDSTMGFTALDGIPMGTRPGQLDPGIVLWLISHEGMTVDDVTELLYHGSGLRGLSGISGDMRDLLESNDRRAGFAIDHFVHRCALHAGMLAAALEGLDGVVFTAGIGENAPALRARIAARLGWLGAELDQSANDASAVKISASRSSVGLYVIPTDEELIIAQQTLALLR
ncbi:acetate/propionate family kinase [Roseobacter ponti]|uniref:Acetate kinase n=1 Tax=Roseobacter ponti TaxID=1891787 RepID=A0A858SU44_9RHOB|nr:acetate/propionate family kinase [Roseobacter ponti]QJF51527.1 acetate/propionate family kinase [Roseobacter ponti]